MRWIFWGIADHYNSNRYFFNLTARHGGNGKTIAIPSARYAVKITVHKRWHTLKQLNTWRVVPVGSVLLK
jgi:hypothetical protein